MKKDFLKKLGLKQKNNGTSTGLKSTASSKKYIESYSPVDGNFIGSVSVTSKAEYNRVVKTSQKAFTTWRQMPAPKRGEIVRQYGEELRKHKDSLGRLVPMKWEKAYKKVLEKYKR